MANSVQFVKVEATEHGVHVRLWIDDERGQHLAVAETAIPMQWIMDWSTEVHRVRDRVAQQELVFRD